LILFNKQQNDKEIYNRGGGLMKKILLLGGSAQQIPAIEGAKKQGCYTVLCDYLPDNPGQYHADKFYCVSTTDKETILEIAVREKVDGILAYASDPAAPTAAYVAEKMGLPTSPYSSVEILTQKDKFRQFLKENGFKPTFDMAIDAVRPGGNVSLIGVFEKPQELAMNTLWIKNITISMGLVNANRIPELIKLIQAGKINTNFLITHRAPLNDIVKGYDIFGGKKDGCLKWVVTPYQR
jgi:threonine dehydrogenase-like Zn-dependent dehydrogenase